MEIELSVSEKEAFEKCIEKIIKGLINIANALGIKLIAKNIETFEQLKLLKRYKYKYFQGNYLGQAQAIQTFKQ
jgi:EAL domain-containing protein (putative c-di-GMP-specific phosphodiesterase class I)